MEIEARGSLTFRDLWRTTEIHYWRSPARKTLHFLASPIFLVFGALQVTYGNAPVFGYLLIALGIWASAGQLAYVLLWARWYWKGSPSLKLENRWSFTSQGIRVSSPAGESTVKWSGVTRWREGPEHFLIYVSRTIYIPVPKRFLQETGSVEALRHLLKEKTTTAS